MDHLRTELKGHYHISNKITQLIPVVREDIKTAYVPFVDLHATDTVTKLDIWHHKNVNRGLVTNNLCKAMNHTSYIQVCMPS